MKLRKLVKLASKGYEKDFPESSLTEFTDKAGVPLRPMPSGDSLAAFIVRELHETYIPDVSRTAQLVEAVRVMEAARLNLDNVIEALQEAIKD